MWTFYSPYFVIQIVFLPSFMVYWSVSSLQSSYRVPYYFKSHLQKINYENVLSKSKPPNLGKELPSYIAFYATEDLRIRCNITGSPPIAYRWYMSTADLSDNAAIIQDESYNLTSSTNDNILTIKVDTIKTNYFKRSYFCSAQNSLGTLQTNKVVVQKVTRPDNLAVKYIRHSVSLSEKFVVQCRLEPDIVPLFKFKHWEIHYNGHNMNISGTVGRFSVILSTKWPQLHVRNVTEDDFSQTKYRCTFQSNINTREIHSSYFQSVEKFQYDYFPLSIKLACIGETVSAIVGSNIELPFCSVPKTVDVNWYKIDAFDSKIKTKIGHNINDTKFAMISSRYGNLLIKNVTKFDAGKYLVMSKNKRLQTTFTLKIYEIPFINLSPRNIQRKMAERAEFVCSTNLPKSEFRWLHNGIRIASGYDNGNVEVVSTQNQSVLKVKKIQLSVSGIYQCMAGYIDEMKNALDSIQIAGTLLISEIPPMLVKQSPRAEKDSSSAQIQMSRDGRLQTIECVFAANPQPNIEWYHNSNKIPITSAINFAIERDQNSIYNIIAKMIINFKEISSDDDIRNFAGEYQSTASNNLGFTTCSTFMLMDGNLEIKLPKKQTAVGGSDYTMTCFFVAMDVPEFFWDRKIDNTESWETLPVNHRTILMEKGHRLHIRNVIKSEDEGTYRCTIKHNKETKMAETRLFVAYPPILQNLPTNHDSTQSQTHICTIKNTADKPWYAWWTFTRKNSNESVIITPSNKDTMFTVYYNQVFRYNELLTLDVPKFLSNYPNTAVDLSVKARTDDKDIFGEFVCHARNHIGYDEKIIQDNYLRLEFKKVPPSSTEVVVGDNLYIDCTAKESELKTVVKWRLLKEESKYVDINDFKHQYNDRIFQYNNGTLVINNIKESDPSKLICFIFPIGKSDKVQSKISYIEIRVPAWIQDFDREIYKVSGSSFNLSCHIYGNEQNLLVSWYFRSSEMEEWNNVYKACIYSTENQCINQYQSNGMNFSPYNEIHNRTYHSIHLEFRDVTESISGHYKCEALNKFNREMVRKTTTLTIISKPSPVLIDTYQRESTSTSISVNWKPPEKNGNRPVFQYVITYYEMLSFATDGNVKNMTQRKISVKSSVHSLVIDQLRPYKKYGVNIVAENEVGASEAVTVYLKTQESQPERPVNNLVASSTKPHEILISWSDPDPEYQNGHIIRYQICYQIIASMDQSRTGPALDKLSWLDNSANVGKNTKVKCEESKVKTLTVSFLPQFTDFAIRVIAFNNKGASPPQFTRVRTLEDLPRAAPSHVTCESEHQAISLTWNPPDRQTINGILKGYVVYYFQPNKFNDESSMKSISVQGRTSVTIYQLKPYTLYSIQIMAENRKGLGPGSASVYCTTKEARPEAPDMVKAIKINSTCLYISWLHTPNPNGIIKEYCVVGLDYNVKSRKCQRPELNKRYNTMIFCDNDVIFSSVQVYARNYYDGAVKEASVVDDVNYIISFGGSIFVDEGSSIILPCETSISNKNIYWKREGQVLRNNAYPNIRILKNFSLEVSSIGKLDRHVYSCSTEFDIEGIEYRLFLKESPNSTPRTPIIDDFRVTENSVFIRWKSKGSTDMAAPITGFVVNWKNLYTGEANTETLGGGKRSFYLNNVTCASYFELKVSAQSHNDRSPFSETKQLRTLGSEPLIADSSVLLPRHNIEPKSANFNLLAFDPGDNCSAINYSIWISLPPTNFTIIYKNISVYNLENKCCYKVIDLHPMTTYKYVVTAYNPAGSTKSFSVFTTTNIERISPIINENVVTFGKHFWLLISIFLIVLILISIVVIVCILQIVRTRAKKPQNVPSKVSIRKTDYNQNRIEKPGNHDDTASIGSEPSPYAVYQPETDPKIGQIRTQLSSQQNASGKVNYADHHYNHIRYDKILGRPITLENKLDNHRRANSAECLSSLGNASVSGVADLESPDNIDPNDYLRGPYLPNVDNDEIFRNIQYPDFSTISKRKIRRESEGTGPSNDAETSRLMVTNNSRGAMNTSRHYDSSGSRGQPSQPSHRPATQHELQAMYPILAQPGNPNRHVYRQQMSVPEQSSQFNYQYGNRRQRSTSGSGRNPMNSQTVLPQSSGSSGIVSGFGSQYGSRGTNIQLYAPSATARRDSDQQNNQYSSYIAGSGLSNYNPVHRTVPSKPAMERIESPDEGIYTDRVIVV